MLLLPWLRALQHLQDTLPLGKHCLNGIESIHDPHASQQGAHKKEASQSSEVSFMPLHLLHTWSRVVHHTFFSGLRPNKLIASMLGMGKLTIRCEKTCIPHRNIMTQPHHVISNHTTHDIAPLASTVLLRVRFQEIFEKIIFLLRSEEILKRFWTKGSLPSFSTAC